MIPFLFNSKGLHVASVAHSAMAGLIGPLVGTSLKKILKSEISQTFEKTVIKKSRQSSIDSRARARS